MYTSHLYSCATKGKMYIYLFSINCSLILVSTGCKNDLRAAHESCVWHAWCILFNNHPGLTTRSRLVRCTEKFVNIILLGWLELKTNNYTDIDSKLYKYL